MNGYSEEINGNKYLTLVPTNESKNIMERYEELWSKIRDLFRSITNNSDDSDEKYMKTKLNLDGDLPLNKTLEIRGMIKVFRTVFHKNSKYDPLVFLNGYLYKLKMLYFKRIDVSEGIDINKTSESKEYNN